MIGWLIEQKDVGGGRQHARQRGTACFAAGKVGRMFFACESSKLLEEIAGRMVVVARDAIGFDISQRRFEAGEIWLLRQVAHQGTRLHENRAAIGLHQPGCNFEQGRFARAVTANEANPLSSADREFRTGEQGVPPNVRAMSLSCRRGGAISPISAAVGRRQCCLGVSDLSIDPVQPKRPAVKTPVPNQGPGSLSKVRFVQPGACGIARVIRESLRTGDRHPKRARVRQAYDTGTTIPKCLELMNYGNIALRSH